MSGHTDRHRSTELAAHSYQIFPYAAYLRIPVRVWDWQEKHKATSTVRASFAAGLFPRYYEKDVLNATGEAGSDDDSVSWPRDAFTRAKDCWDERSRRLYRIGLDPSLIHREESDIILRSNMKGRKKKVIEA